MTDRTTSAVPGIRTPPPAAVSERMSRLRRAGTGPELAVRRALHARGLRYRVQTKVPGNNRRTIDIAFTRARVAVFVDGCFWHGCPQHATTPKANRDWWVSKIATNRSRDDDTDHLLHTRDWSVVRIWEHEEVPVAVNRIVAELERRLPG